MANSVQYQVKGFEITVFDTAYLVEVRRLKKRSHSVGNSKKLPEWTLRSPHAIWLTDEKAPILIRAANGDRIKNQILFAEVV